MNTKYMKRLVLGVPVVLLLITFIADNPVVFGFCNHVAMWDSGTKYCVDKDILPEYISQIIGFVSLSLIFLSIITYRLKDEIFRAWWSFALWWVPVIVIVTLLLENAGGGGGGWGISSGLFEFAILWLFYIIFITTSLVKIIKAHFVLKWKDQGMPEEHLLKLKRQMNQRILLIVPVILIALYFLAYTI